MKNKYFVLTLLILLILGLGIFIKPQNELSQMEKRELNTIKNISFNSSTSKEVENVMKDQFYFRDYLTHTYYQGKVLLNRSTDFITNFINKTYQKFKAIISKEDNYNNDNWLNNIELTYLGDDVIEINDSYLINGILEYNDEQLSLASAKGYNVNEFDLKYPNIKTYVYFPIRIEEILNQNQDYKPLCKEVFASQLNKNISHDYLKINSLDDFQRYYYKTDRHWKVDGAYEAYKDIINMISKDFDLDEIKNIKEEIIFDYDFKGNISSQIGMIGEADHIKDYVLEDMKEFDYYANGVLRDFNETKKDYQEHENDTIFSDYDLYFGGYYFQREFDFHNEDKPNLLIFSDSYVNTNMDWIASHFNKTFTLDFRAQTGEFDLENFIEENEIDIVLVLQMYQNLYFNGNMFIPLD